MNIDIVLSGVARCMVAMSSRARAQDYAIGTAFGAASEMFTIASRISPFIITLKDIDGCRRALIFFGEEPCRGFLPAFRFGL